MAFTNHTLSGLLGLNVQGDLAGFTMYTGSNGQLVVFAKSPPLQPASPLQRIYRSRFAAIAKQWQALPATTRTDWERLSKAAHCKMTGYNLFTWLQTTGDRSAIETIQRQTGIVVL